jgi:hypothetical protein
LPGQAVRFFDGFGALGGSFTISLARGGSDTINGGTASVVCSTKYGSVDLISDGVSKWTVVRSTVVPTNAISASDIDWSKSKVHSKTLSANTTFTMSNTTDGDTIRVALTNTASNWTASWTNPSGLTIKWPAGTTPTLTTGAKSDVFEFTRAGAIIYGRVTQNY